MKTYIVQLEDHDDVISARDRLSWSKARRILLVWPLKGRVLERRVDILLLQRHGQQLGAQIAFVTKSSEVKMHAVELGIPVFSDVVRAQHSTWRVRVRRKDLREGIQPDLNLARPSLREQQAARVSAQTAEFFTKAARRGWVRIGMFAFAIAACLVLGLAFLPAAEVDIKPVRKPQEITMAVWASPNIPAPNASGGFPAQVSVVVVEGRDQADSTGWVSIPDQYATGQVLLTNLTDQPVDIPAGSVLLGGASGGGDLSIHFITTQAARAPAGPGKNVSVAIRAVAPGQVGNLPASQIRAMEGLPGLRLLVNNPEPTRGGTDRNGRMPTDEDYRGLRDKLLARLRGNAIEEAQVQLKSGQRLLDGALQVHSIIEEMREPAEGQPADRLQLALRVEYEAWYINEVDLTAVARAVLEANREKGFQAVPGTLKITFASLPKLGEDRADQPANGAQAANSGSGQVSTNRSVGTTVQWDLRIEQVLEASWSKAAITQAIQGRTAHEALMILQTKLKLAEPSIIHFYPGWWKRLPFLPTRIQWVSQ